jgi:hypothetical protein
MALDYFLGAQLPSVLPDAVLVDRDLERIVSPTLKRKIRSDEEEELERWRQLGLI